jgi:ribosomal protein L29
MDSNQHQEHSQIPSQEAVHDENVNEDDDADIYQLDVDELRRQLAEKRAESARGERFFKDLESRFVELKEELSNTRAENEDLQNTVDSLRKYSSRRREFSVSAC